MRSNAPFFSIVFYGLAAITGLGTIITASQFEGVDIIIPVVAGIVSAVFMITIGLALHYLRELVTLSELQYALTYKSEHKSHKSSTGGDDSARNSIGLAPGYKMGSID